MRLAAFVVLSVFCAAASAQSAPPRSVGKDLMVKDLPDLAESLSDVHVMSKNPSDTVPVKALIFMVKEKGVPATTLVKD